MNEEEEPVLIRAFGDSSKCGFCAQNVLEGTGIVIKACLHTLCQYCIEEVIMGSASEIVNCIVYEDGHQKCSGALLQSEIKAILPADAYNLYLTRISNQVNSDIRQAPNFFQCANSNCTEGFIIDDGVLDFVCTGCLFHTCIICKCTTNRPPGTNCEGECDNFSTDPTPLPGPQVEVGRPKGKKRKFSVPDPIPPVVIKKPVIDPKFAFNEGVKQDFLSGWDQIMEKIRSIPSSSASDDNEKVIEFINQHDFIENLKEFECTICLMEVPPGDGVILKDCYHLFCKICLSSVVENCEDAKVKCPFQANGYSCVDFIQDREIRALVSQEIFEKHIGRSLQKAELSNLKAFHCKTVNCNYWCEVEVVDESFVCPNCNKINCIKCAANHENVTCAEYQAKVSEEEADPQSRNALMKMIKQGKAKRCPNCRIVILKDGGCNHMHCKICNYHFNWTVKSGEENIIHPANFTNVIQGRAMNIVGITPQRQREIEVQAQDYQRRLGLAQIETPPQGAIRVRNTELLDQFFQNQLNQQTQEFGNVTVNESTLVYFAPQPQPIIRPPAYFHRFPIPTVIQQPAQQAQPRRRIVPTRPPRSPRSVPPSTQVRPNAEALQGPENPNPRNPLNPLNLDPSFLADISPTNLDLPYWPYP